jgi:hypothetical protein
MGLFKKKEKAVVTEIKCPVEGCGFICFNQTNLNRHLEWKHPDYAGTEGKTSVRVS